MLCTYPGFDISKIGHAVIVFKTITPKVRSVYFSSYKIIARKNDTVELLLKECSGKVC